MLLKINTKRRHEIGELIEDRLQQEGKWGENCKNLVYACMKISVNTVYILNITSEILILT